MTLALALSALLAAPLGPKSLPVRPPASWSASERAVAAQVSAAEISGHIRFLADDLLEGRKPGTPGSELTVKYLAAQLEAMGLSPGAPATKAGAPASYLQPVPLVELVGKVPPLVSFRRADKTLELRTTGGLQSELILSPEAHTDLVHVENAELVFAGYGIVAPEFGWDDYKDVDVRGKIVVLLNFNPPFAGDRVRLWYGRWDYKYLQAAKHGAAGAVIIHTTESAGYGWQVLASSGDGAKMDLPPGPDPLLQFSGWLSEAGARKLATFSGHDLDALVASATGPKARSFRPLSLGTTSSLHMPVARRTTESANVLGLLRGTDPALREEVVLYTAHHDHLGKSAPTPPETDGIYNGALDNASGVAAVLAIARAARAAPPRRSLLFCLVTAEEQGLLGSRWLAQHPPVPPGRIAAGINIDEINFLGRTRDLTVEGLGKSSLDPLIRSLARAQGRKVIGDQHPDRGSFYRSDHFELARIGVPVATVRGGTDVIGRPAHWGEEQNELFESKRYHQPSDEYRGDWDLSGAVEDAQLQLVLGLRVANASALPSWTPGDEFEAARKQARRASEP